MILTLFLRTKPATGDEYKIMMCRSTSATGGFVDQSGVACTSSGGTTLLASHGTTYGPGGQQVLPSLLCHQKLICLEQRCVYRLKQRTSALLSLRRHGRRTRRWQLPVWLERSRMVEWVADCLDGRCGNCTGGGRQYCTGFVSGRSSTSHL